jgi:hypothetical protein
MAVTFAPPVHTAALDPVKVLGRSKALFSL